MLLSLNAFCLDIGYLLNWFGNYDDNFTETSKNKNKNLRKIPKKPTTLIKDSCTKISIRHRSWNSLKFRSLCRRWFKVVTAAPVIIHPHKYFTYFFWKACEKPYLMKLYNSYNQIGEKKFHVANKLTFFSLMNRRISFAVCVGIFQA